MIIDGKVRPLPHRLTPRLIHTFRSLLRNSRYVTGDAAVIRDRDGLLKPNGHHLGPQPDGCPAMPSHPAVGSVLLTLLKLSASVRLSNMPATDRSLFE